MENHLKHTQSEKQEPINTSANSSKKTAQEPPPQPLNKDTTGLGKQKKWWDLLQNNLFFTLFLTLIGLLYIWNSHRAEKLGRYSETLQRNIRELKSEYMTLNANISLSRSESEIAAVVDSFGLKPLEHSAYKLSEKK